MKAEELRASARLATSAYAGTVSHIEMAHARITARAFRPIGVVASPVRVVHDAVTRAAYSTVRAVGSVVGVTLSEVLPALAAGSADRPAGSSPRSNLALATLNAALGDRLAGEQDPLAIAMAVRVNRRDLPLVPDSLAAGFPAATGKVAVFVHGLAETEDLWRLAAGPDGTTYGTRLAADFGYSPVYVRYNSGRHVSDNGRDLSRLLEQLVSSWPVEVDDLMLVGHSMGGLVARSSCHLGQQGGLAWVTRVRHVVLLGSPHLGAPLARWADYAARALARAGEPWPFATLVTTRSAGIDDLRYGYLVEDDWAGCDVATCRTDHRHDIPLLATANHYTVSATVARRPESHVGRIVGDLLVQPASATGRHGATQRIPFSVDSIHQVARINHFQLLNHPAVYHVLRARLDPAPGGRSRDLGPLSSF